MVKVVEHGRFKVYVYAEAGGQHNRSHCHVYWGDRSASVAIPGLEVLDGDALPKVARELLGEHRDKIEDMWDLLNPGRPIK